MFVQTDFLETVRTDRFFSFQLVCLYKQIRTFSSKMAGEAGLFASEDQFLESTPILELSANQCNV